MGSQQLVRELRYFHRGPVPGPGAQSEEYRTSSTGAI